MSAPGPSGPLVYSQSGKHNSLTSSMQNFNMVTSFCSVADWFESYLVGNPEDRFPHNEAHIF